MAYDYEDPKKALAYLFNPSVALPDTDSAAAAAAIGGGMPGSMFAQNNQLRLRDSERIGRLKLGEELLQPYLQRESAERMQGQQIAANAAQQAITESGAMARLSAEQAGALQRALISGNQQAAHDLLMEAGQDRRQAATLTANLQERTMANQTNILQSLLGYAGAQGKAGAGAGGAPSTRGYVPPGYQSTEFTDPNSTNARQNLFDAPEAGAWRNDTSQQGGIYGINTTINRLLRTYGL